MPLTQYEANMKVELTLEMVQSTAFYQSRPKSIQKLIDKLPGTHEYEIIETEHICTIHSYNENGTVTIVRALVEGDRENFGLDEKTDGIQVFGLFPKDLRLRKDLPIMVEKNDRLEEEIKIVKIQRSLAGSTDEEQVLIYDKTKEFLYEGPLTGDVNRFMGEDDKVYGECSLLPNKDKEGKDLGTFRFSLIHRVKDQEW